MRIILANPQAMEQCLLDFFLEMASAESNYINGPGEEDVQLRDTFRQVSNYQTVHAEERQLNVKQVLVQYKAMIPDFDEFLHHLPPDKEQNFRQIYKL